MLNTAGWDYDYGQVVYAVLQECEHRRRSSDESDFDHDIETAAIEKLARIKAAYDEVGGTPEYWEALEKEVLDVVVPQYADAARRMNALERTNFDVWRSGDVAARATFALIGLLVGSVIVALPFVPIFENMFAFALTVAGFLYPDLKRYTFERRYSKLLNRLIADSTRYQENARVRYMTSADFDKALELPPGPDDDEPPPASAVSRH